MKQFQIGNFVVASALPGLDNVENIRGIDPKDMIDVEKKLTALELKEVNIIDSLYKYHFKNKVLEETLRGNKVTDQPITLEDRSRDTYNLCKADHHMPVSKDSSVLEHRIGNES